MDRSTLLKLDDALASLVEAGFRLWRLDTVWPDAVNRWIADCGRLRDRSA